MKKILIANRGEIALRAIRACRKNGLTSVAVYSTADAASPHVFAADEAYCIGPPAPRESYLVGDNLIETAAASGCDGVYPGYGFLAENADFADECARRGLVFIGPSGQAIRQMGDKAHARETARRLGVPVVPGSPGAYESLDAARAAAGEVGFPMLIKASAGGGGRGMRVARSADEFDDVFTQANAEAQAAFGNGELYLERYFDRVRHIEIQVFADRHGNAQHLWERDCSVQRRHQKLVEEAPSPVLDNTVRKEMAEAALAIVTGIGYENAGTVEFIYDMESRKFFFIEMNTRIQVEHPVTEMFTNTDLVSEQLRVAAGKRLRLPRLKRLPRGAFIEWRICAEDPSDRFMPSVGRITSIARPAGPSLRFDTHAYPGYDVPPYYDSMIGKLIVGGDNRKAAIDRSRHALRTLDIGGIKTTTSFHLDLIDHQDFIDSAIYTRWVEERLRA